MSTSKRQRRPRGHIERRGLNRYRLWVPLGKGPDGRYQHYKETFHGTEEDAKRRLTELLHQMDAGRISATGEVPFEAYLQEWYRYVASVETGILTHREYKRLMDKRIIPALGSITLNKLRPIHIKRFYASLLQDGLSPASVRKIHAVISGSLNYAVQMQLINDNPASSVTLPKARRPEKRKWTLEQLQKFITFIKDSPHKALIMTLAYTGMRLGEALALKWSSVDFDRGVIRVEAALKRSGPNPIFGPPKDHQVREIPMNEELYRVLKEHRRNMLQKKLVMGTDWNPWDVVFPNENGNPMSGDNFRKRVWKPLIEEAGVPYINIHGLRHTFATITAKLTDAATLRDLLGHESAAFTMDEYVHPDDDDKRQAVSMFSKRLRAARE
mgnify:CR=1 FL=1